MRLFPAGLLLFFIAAQGQADTNSCLFLGKFSSGLLDNWQSKEFSGITDYQLVRVDNTLVLQAKSSASASGLYKEQRIDLHKTPFLNWQWRIENQLPGKINEQAKSGDDYSARLYIVVKGGWAFWNTRAINYVWASHTEKGKIWPNAFAGKHAMMIALRSHNDRIGTWYQEKRNILIDFKQQFGETIQYIDVVALMTDTDNTQNTTVAYYGDIYFSEK